MLSTPSSNRPPPDPQTAPRHRARRGAPQDRCARRANKRCPAAPQTPSTSSNRARKTLRQRPARSRSTQSAPASRRNRILRSNKKWSCVHSELVLARRGAKSLGRGLDLHAPLRGLLYVLEIDMHHVTLGEVSGGQPLAEAECLGLSGTGKGSGKRRSAEYGFEMSRGHDFPFQSFGSRTIGGRDRGSRSGRGSRPNRPAGSISDPLSPVRASGPRPVEDQCSRLATAPGSKIGPCPPTYRTAQDDMAPPAIRNDRCDSQAHRVNMNP